MYYFNTFADITGLFTDKEIREMDNLVDIPYPETALSEWYDSAKRDYTLKQWLDDAWQNVGNQAGKTEEVYTYLINHGWEWTRHFNPRLGDSITVEYNRPEEEKKPMTRDEYRKEILEHLENEDVETRISEFVFDTVDLLNDFRLREKLNNAFEDSRDLFQTILDWAYEFEYNWTCEGSGCDGCYMDVLEEFVKTKMKEYETHTYTVVFNLRGRVTVKAASEEEARCLASGMPIEYDEEADIVNTIKED